MSNQKKSTSGNKKRSKTLNELESLENQTLKIDTSLLKKLNHDDIKEVYQVFDDLDDEESKNVVLKTMKKIKPSPIEKARLGHRIWTYFYEKMIFRVAVVVWFFLSGFLIKIFSVKIPLPPDFDVSKMPGFLRKLLFSESQDNFTFIIGLLVIWLVWRFWIAFLESKKNRNHSGSTLLRRQLGLVIVNRKGEPISLLLTLVRGLFRIPVISMLMIIWMEYSKDVRGLHDLIFKTYVIRINQDVSTGEIARFIEKSY